jgi:hypothetical protein
MKTAREWVLSQPGGEDFGPEELAEAAAAIDARDRELVGKIATHFEKAHRYLNRVIHVPSDNLARIILDVGGNILAGTYDPDVERPR